MAHIRGLVASMIADDYFSEDEERHLVATAEAQGMP